MVGVGTRRDVWMWCRACSISSLWRKLRAHLRTGTVRVPRASSCIGLVQTTYTLRCSTLTAARRSRSPRPNAVAIWRRNWSTAGQADQVQRQAFGSGHGTQAPAAAIWSRVVDPRQARKNPAGWWQSAQASFRTSASGARMLRGSLVRGWLLQAPRSAGTVEPRRRHTRVSARCNACHCRPSHQPCPCHAGTAPGRRPGVRLQHPELHVPGGVGHARVGAAPRHHRPRSSGATLGHSGQPAGQL